VKNSVVFLGAASTAHGVAFAFWRDTAVAIVTFCILSSAGYVFNDVSDIQSDREHPVKRSRPVAAGLVTTPCAVTISIALCALALPMAWSLGRGFFLRAILYLAICVAYSTCLKRVPYVEMGVIALGFLIRLDAGVVLGGGGPTPLLIAAVAFAIVFLTVSKRVQELSLCGTAGSMRQVLRFYSRHHLRNAMPVAGFTAIALFIAYGLNAESGTILKAQMTFTLPLVVLGFVRYMFLIVRITNPDDPTLLFTRDRTLRYIFVLWLGAVLLSLAFPSLLPSMPHGGLDR
jgi:4-hydroxybenzoate polyprenyltransferase